MARGATATQDATQGEAERNREVRKGYRDLQQDIIKNKDDLGDYSKDSLQQALANADKLHEQVNRPREQAKDSEVFCTLAASGVEQAKKLAAGAKSRTAKDVIRRLKFRFATDAAEVEDDPTAYDWAAAGLHCLHLFGCAVGVGCMLGPLNAQPKVRKVTERRERTKLGALEKPQEIKEVNTEEKQETDRLMEEMFEVLQEHSPVPWLELIMNVESFSQTVENIFTLSFLVRDSKVSFTKDAEKGMLVSLVNPRKEGSAGTAGEKAPAEKERVQSMQSYSMLDWQDWRDYVQPADCLMQHRTGQMYTDLEAVGPSGTGTSASQAPPKGLHKRAQASTAEREDSGGESDGAASDEEDPQATRKKLRQKRPTQDAVDDDSDDEADQRSDVRNQKSKRRGNGHHVADSDGESCQGGKSQKKKAKRNS